MSNTKSFTSCREDITGRDLEQHQILHQFQRGHHRSRPRATPNPSPVAERTSQVATSSNTKSFTSCREDITGRDLEQHQILHQLQRGHHRSRPRATPNPSPVAERTSQVATSSNTKSFTSCREDITGRDLEQHQILHQFQRGHHRSRPRATPNPSPVAERTSQVATSSTNPSPVAERTSQVATWRRLRS